MFEILFKYPASDFERGELVFTSAWPASIAAMLAAIGLVAITLFLARRRAPGRLAQLCAVGGLQVAMLAVAVFVLLQPALRTEELRPGVNTLALVLDASASMAQGDGTTRFANGLEELEAVTAAASGDEFRISRYLLGDGLTRVESYAGAAPDAPATDIGRGLESVLAAGSTEALAAVVLVSDGIDTAGDVSAETLATLAAAGVPVHTIGIGRERMPEDLELARISLPTEALPGSTLTARVSIRHDAPGAARIKVYDGDALAQSVPVVLPEGVATTAVAIDIPVDEPGYHRLGFALEGDWPETELRNNRQAALVQVAEDDFRILYYEGEPRWEYKFMRRALGEDSDIALATLLQVSPNKFYRQGIASPEDLENGFPATRDELFVYDALIVGSVEAASFSAAQLDNIRAFVSERGGSLLMIAGRNGLGDGGWGQSAIADVLPARLPPSSEASFVREKVPVRLTPQGMAYLPLRFAADDVENGKQWEGLPEIADYQRLAALKPAARTFLTVRTATGELPLFVMQPFGRGHAFVLATGGTWRWQMSLPLEDDRHERFWRQLLRALVSSAPRRTSVTAQRGAGTTVEVRAEIRDAAFAPVDDVRVSAIASHEAGESQVVELVPSEEPGVYTGRFDPRASGNWYVEAIARQADEIDDLMRTGIYVEPDSREHFNLRANPALLRRISEATGGSHFAAGDLAALPDLLETTSAGVTETVDRALWDAPAWFLLLFLIKAGEWLLRRRWSSI